MAHGSQHASNVSVLGFATLREFGRQPGAEGLNLTDVFGVSFILVLTHHSKLILKFADNQRALLLKMMRELIMSLRRFLLVCFDVSAE